MISNKEFSHEKLNEIARKRIIITVIAGLILVIADLIAGMSAGNIELVESGGNIYMMRPDEGDTTGHLYMAARIKTDEGIIEKNITITLDPYEKNSNKEDKKSPEKVPQSEYIDYEFRTMMDNFNKDRSVKQIILPGSLDTGEKILWKKELRTNTEAIIMCMIILSVIIYMTRLDPIKKLQKTREESVMLNLPEFVNRLVLLLNAGMVLNSAFEKTIEESMRYGDENDYFNSKMQEIYISVKNTNGVMHYELRKFAKESGIKELMRISNIINDNINKGSELTQKLLNENDILWVARKRNCEERCRLAETKLTLPLVIFLVILIVIVVSPALLEL